MSRSLTRKHYHHALNRLETLEPRTLLSVATTTPYAVDGLAGLAATYDSAGNLWVLNFNTNSLDQVASSGATPIRSISLGSASPIIPAALAAGPNGALYLADSAGGIDVIDTNGVGSATQHLFTTSSSPDVPLALTVSGDGAVWFIGTAAGTGTSTIGRFIPATNPANDSLTELTTGPALSDSYPFTLAPSGNSVWIAFNANIDNNIVVGHNHIVAASYSGGSITPQVYAISTGDALTNQNFISSIVDGGDGSVWFTLATNNIGNVGQVAPDQIVQGTPSGSAIVIAPADAHILPGANASTSLQVTSLNFDANGNLWFAEAAGSEFGFLGTSGFSLPLYSAATSQLQMVSNPAGDQLSIISSGPDIIQIDVPIDVPIPPVPAVTFHFDSVSTIHRQEDTNIAGTLLAQFTAPDPVSLTGYTATITWGDATTSNVAATPMGANTWAIIAPTKSFATQGTYVGSITVKDGATTVGITTSLNPLTSVIGDIALNVNSFTASPLLLRIVTAVGTFTDDGDLALSTWHATITWGDNSSSTAIIVRDPSQAGRYLVLAVHQYRTRGTFNVRLTVTTTEAGAAITNSTLTSTVTAR